MVPRRNPFRACAAPGAGCGQRGRGMFTVIAFFAGALMGWAATRINDKDRATYDRLDNVEVTRALLLHSRQEMKLIAYLLFAILIMLGVIADHSWMRATGLTLDAGDGAGGQQSMIQTDTIAIITIVIAIIGAAAATVSAVSARR